MEHTKNFQRISGTLEMQFSPNLHVVHLQKESQTDHLIIGRGSSIILSVSLRLRKMVQIIKELNLF